MSVTVTHAQAHDHPEFLRHHFDTPKQQFEASKLGMWMFLATEVLLFGGLFVGYSVWRGNHPELFKYGSQFLNTTLGATNTAVLILSSLTMAAAVTMAQRGKRAALILLLALTLAGAVTFLVIKYFEYTHKFHEGWFPGMRFYEPPPGPSHTWGHYPTPEIHPVSPQEAEAAAAAAARLQGLPPAEPTTVPAAADGPGGLSALALDDGAHAGPEHHVIHPLQDPDRPNNAHMFFNIYFMMTGLHGVHVFGGVLLLTWLIIGAAKGRFNEKYFTPIDLGGLYWHIVDLIWIFLFPLFYLI